MYEYNSEEYYAFQEGYRAGIEYNLGSGQLADNPYRGARYYAWENGFRQAGEDS
jgi:hypothetical protein